MHPNDEIVPLTGDALKKARRELKDRQKQATLRWYLDEARKLLEHDPPYVFEAITHIDGAIAKDIEARRNKRRR